jgi:hypothetical protein
LRCCVIHRLIFFLSLSYSLCCSYFTQDSRFQVEDLKLSQSLKQSWDLSHSIWSQMQTVPIRTRCLCLLCRGKGHAHIIKSTDSRLGKHLLSKGISQKPFLTDLAGDRYKKNLPSFKDNSLSCIQYVRKYCSLSCVPSLSRNLLHTVAQRYLLSNIVFC